MNAETDVEEVPKENPKSKRLSSLIWMLVLWLGVRGCSEMDGISWERAFPIASLFFGLWPATLFLTASVFISKKSYETFFRWMAVISVFGSFFSGFLFKNQKNAESFVLEGQIIFVVLIFVSVVIHWNVTRRSYG